VRIGACEKCGAKIMMAKHVKTRNPAPIEVQPSDDGNILVTGTHYEIVPAEEREKVKRRGFVLRKNHFATCTHAKQFAKKKPAALRNVVRGPWRSKAKGAAA
jgi:hypothetical protein